MTAVAMEKTPVHPAAAAIDERNWRTAAIAMLALRITLGFIYWGGGSRRFIYAPDKLNPDAHSWMANKFQTAMPGALFGFDQVISFLLLHFDLLYAGLIVFSAAELISGVMLMAGFLTRLAALASMGFSVLLMIAFGWQGGTCVDEWTMAVVHARHERDAAPGRQRRLFHRQSAAAPRQLAGDASLVSLDGRQPALAADQPGLPLSRSGAAGGRPRLHPRHLRLLSRLDRHRLSRRPGQPDRYFISRYRMPC